MKTKFGSQMKMMKCRKGQKFQNIKFYWISSNRRSQCMRGKSHTSAQFVIILLPMQWEMFQDTLNQDMRLKDPHKSSIYNYCSSHIGNLKALVEWVHENKKPHDCSTCDNSSSHRSNLKTQTID